MELSRLTTTRTRNAVGVGLLGRRCIVPTIVMLTLLIAPSHAFEDCEEYTTWHVDASVGTSGDGSENNPFKTIDEALDCADGDGDTVHTVNVAAGTYTEDVLFGTVNLRLIGEVDTDGTPDQTIIVGKAEVVSSVTFTDAVLIEGFTIRAPATQTGSKIGVKCWGRDCDIKNNIIEDHDGGGISLSGSESTVTDCVVQDNLDSGIEVAKSTTSIVDSVIRNNSTSGAGGGIKVTNPDDVFTTVKIVGCEIYDNAATGAANGGGISVVVTVQPSAMRDICGEC